MYVFVVCAFVCVCVCNFQLAAFPFVATVGSPSMSSTIYGTGKVAASPPATAPNPPLTPSQLEPTLRPPPSPVYAAEYIRSPPSRGMTWHEGTCCGCGFDFGLLLLFMMMMVAVTVVVVFFFSVVHTCLDCLLPFFA